MSEGPKIKLATLEWLQDQFEQEVLVFVNNPESCCESEREDEHKIEMALHYKRLLSVGDDIGMPFWNVIEGFLDGDDSQSVERVNKFKRLVLPGVENNARS